MAENHEIKVVALDIYGTVLSSFDSEDVMPPRKGLEAFLDKCKKRKIKVVSASDADPDNLQLDLKVTFENHRCTHLLRRFSKFYRLDQYPHKDFSIIVKDWGIKPAELLVIGDSDKDIGGAIKHKTCYFRVPEYTGVGDDFDLSKIEF